MKHWPIVFALGLGCDSSKSTFDASGDFRQGLRIQLPDGWKANPIGGDLQIGPPGKVVLQLENTTKPLPDETVFSSAIEAEGCKLLDKFSNNTYISYRYSFSHQGNSFEAFLGVHRLGERTIWCATTRGTTAEETTLAMKLCRNLSWEDARHE